MSAGTRVASTAHVQGLVELCLGRVLFLKYGVGGDPSVRTSEIQDNPITMNFILCSRGKVESAIMDTVIMIWGS